MKLVIDDPESQILDRMADTSGRISIGRRKFANKKVRIAILEVISQKQD